MAENDGVTPLPAGTRKQQDLKGYEELNLDDLDAIMQGVKDDPVQPVEEEKPDVEPEPEPADEPVEEGEDDEEEGEDEPEEKPEPEPEKDDEPEEDDKLERRLALLERKLELEALKRERAEEAQKRAELLASRHAGNVGYLKQQLKKKGTKPAVEGDATAEDPDDFIGEPGEEREDVEQTRSEPQPAFDETRAELVSLAINDEGNKFTQEHASELQKMPEGFADRLSQLVREEAAPHREFFRSGSMKSVRKVARSIFASAYATARIEFMEKAAEEAAAKEAASAAKSKRLKKKAAISKNGRGPAKPKPKPRSYEDMSEAELEAEFEREFGNKYRRGADRR